MAMYSFRILSAGFFLVTLCPFTTASTWSHVSKDNDKVQSLDPLVNDQFRSLRRRSSHQYRKQKDLSWWAGTAVGTSTTATSAPIISSTSSPLVSFTTVPPTASPSSAPTLNPTVGMARYPPTASPTTSQTFFSSDAPSVPPTTVQSMNSALQNEEAEKLARFIFVSVFVGVYVLLGGGMVIRWLWR